jgi:hypothetical protein
MLFVAGWGSNQKRESREWQCLPVTQREGASLSCQQDTHATCINAEFEDECLSSQRKASPPGVCVCVKSMMWRGPSQSKNKADARAGGAGGGRRRRRRRTYHGSLAAIPTEELKIDNEPNRSPYYRPRSRNGSSTSMYVFSVESSAAAMMGVLR